MKGTLEHCSLVRTGIISAVFVLLLRVAASADVYFYKDERGALTFTNVPCTEEQLKEGCARVVPERQWKWKQDINGDGKVTISDVPGWVKWIFYYPGDWLIYVMLEEKGKGTMAEFLELTPASYGRMLSFLISIAAWTTCLIGFVLLDGITTDLEWKLKTWFAGYRKKIK